MADENQPIEAKLQEFYSMSAPQRLVNYAAYARLHGIMKFFTEKPYAQDPSSFIQKTFQTFYGERETENGYETYFANEEEIIGYFNRLLSNKQINEKTHDVLLQAYVNIICTGGPVPAIINSYREKHNIKADYATAEAFVKAHEDVNADSETTLDDLLATSEMPKMRMKARPPEAKIINFDKEKYA